MAKRSDPTGQTLGRIHKKMKTRKHEKNYAIRPE